MAVVLFTALIPVLLLLIWFYSRDKLHPEPKRHVLRLFFLGMVIVAPAGWIERFLLSVRVEHPEAGILSTLFTAFFVAGVVEEFLKASIFEQGVYRHKVFDEPIDGMVYGVAISLGFAAIENLLYVTSYGLQVAFVRSVTAIPAHAMFGVTMGYYFARARAGRSPKWLAYVIPACLHGVYDSFAMFGGWMGDLCLVAYLLALVVLSAHRIRLLRRPSFRLS